MTEGPTTTTGKSWPEALHWCVRVMETSDTDLPFMASLLSQAAKNGSLSEKQAKYGQRIYDRLRTDSS